MELGLLEEDAGDDLNRPSTLVFRTEVRLAFRFSGGKWLPYDNLSWRDATSTTLHRLAEDLSATTRTWYVVAPFRDAKEPKIRELESSGYIPYDPRKPLAGGAIQPLTGRVKDFSAEFAPRDLAYAGWVGIPVRRPVVLLSRRNLRDPEEWRPVTGPQLQRGVPPEVFLALTRAPDKGIIPTSITLVQKSDWDFWDKRVFYGANDVEIRVEYSSHRGDRLCGIAFKPDARVDEGDYPLGLFFFAWAKGSEPRYLGKFTNVIDKGDFDGDGKTEFILEYTQEDEDGYTLFWHDFSESAKTFWRYH